MGLQRSVGTIGDEVPLRKTRVVDGFFELNKGISSVLCCSIVIAAVGFRRVSEDWVSATAPNVEICHMTSVWSIYLAIVPRDVADYSYSLDHLVHVCDFRFFSRLIV